ncbi:MAG: hypothetical protein Kow00124_24190 [Anaerolineae bacterium]
MLTLLALMPTSIVVFKVVFFGAIFIISLVLALCLLGYCRRIFSRS